MLVRVIFKLHVSWLIMVLIIVHILMSIIGGEMLGLYSRNSWWDKVTHAYGGLMLTGIAFCIVEFTVHNVDIKNKFVFVLVGAIAISLSTALLWEVAEFTIDSVLGSNMQRFVPRANAVVGARFALMDTMYDVLCHLAGLVVFAVMAFFIRNTRTIKNGFKKVNRKAPTTKTSDIA
jgi:hypothetical protein